MDEHHLGALTRRGAAWLLASAVALASWGADAAAAVEGRRGERVPIVFVHGGGDSKAMWTTTLWRFESNGYPRDRLFAVELEPTDATAVYNVPQPGLSTAAEMKRQLAAFVQAVRARTGSRKVALVGVSRGANAIRNYLENGGGAAVTSKVVLGGGVNHGIVNSPLVLVGSEYNGAGPFLQDLNDGPNEVEPGVRFLTLRSDRFDKYAQSDALYLGFPGVPTGVDYTAPALNGARNLVLPGVDHRETALSPQAFAATFRFLAGRAPGTLDIRPQRRSLLSGAVTGAFAGQVYDNVGVQGARLQIYEVRPKTGERVGRPVYATTTGAGGAWGPFAADPRAYHEFALTVPGYPVTHIYRSPFPRGSSLVTLRPALPADASATRSTVIMIRPRGYFGIEDRVLLDGARPEGLPDDPVPNLASLRLTLPPAPQRAVPARFEAERIVVRTWPAGEVSFAEFHF